MAVEFRITSDGSHTLYVPELDETYHSIHGAMQESRHVFIQNGLEWYLGQNPGKKELSVFEMGFGTGLNALLTLQFATNNNIKVNYTSIEKFPLSLSVTEKLNYCNTPELSMFKESFAAMHQTSAGGVLDFERLSFCKEVGDIREYRFNQSYDVVFWDAFAPSIVPELWTVELFSAMRGAMKEGGVLVTYSAKGEVKRNLAAAGFLVERMSGPPGKRHMVRAKNQ